MPANKGLFFLTTAYVEFLHDTAIGLFWPGVEPVSSREYRDRRSIESALMAPFQTMGGKPLVRGIRKKGARIFHSLIANHPFVNGNKRTAILAMQHFFFANGYYLAADPDEIERLAVETAGYRECGVSHDEMLRRITTVLDSAVIPFQELDASTLAVASGVRTWIRSMVTHTDHR